MASPVVCFSRKLFFWNLDANVGIGCPNKPEDVQLVQLGYYCMATSTDPAVPVQLKPTFAAVVPGAPYSGNPTDPLTRAIIAHQQTRGGTQDGHVSVISNTTGTYDSAGHQFMLVALDAQIRRQIPGDYPRIDKHAKCPPMLRAAVIRACTF